MSKPSTAFCLVTPPGEGGISIVEVWGPDAARIVDGLFRSPRGVRVAEMAPGHLAYGRLEQEGELLDEVIVECVDTGASQRLAVNCHGGAMAVRRVQDALEANGAAKGSCGEFLTRTEAADVIRGEAAERIPDAPTLLATCVLLDQYRGALSGVIASVREALAARRGWAEAERLLGRLLETARFGRRLTEPARVVIAGRPNVGKSTLANALLRFERMIVHTTPGTTRDVIEEVISIQGVPFVLADTAGMRDVSGEIEREGVVRAKEQVERADLILLVLDGSEPFQPEDAAVLKAVSVGRTVRVINKCDLPQALSPAWPAEETGLTPVRVSALKGAGMEALERAMLAAVYPTRPERGEAVVFTMRQERHVRAALDAVKRGDAGAALDEIDRLEGRFRERQDHEGREAAQR